MMLCGKPGKCCASIDIIEYGYEIKDDFGGVVKLTKDEFELLRLYDL